MNLQSDTAIQQGMVLASLVGGFALAAIAQLVSAFPRSGEAPEQGTVVAAITRLGVAATIMMINVWTGIVFFLNGGRDQSTIAVIFYIGLLIGVLFFALGMADTVAVASPRLRRPITLLFGTLLVAEALLAIAFLR
jgi:hypothetical protein